MPRDLDLNSQKWLALVFADKNKEYGAYVHRIESSDRHLQAIIIITFIALSLIFLPKFVKSILPTQKNIDQITIVTMSDINFDQEIPEENQIKQIEVPPPPELKTTIAFTPPVITKDENIREEELMISQQDLTETTAAISVATVEGSAEGTVDIADLMDHQVIIEIENKIFEVYNVEEPPAFPGGEKALQEWLARNITYPQIAIDQGITGRVYLRFVVKPDGSIGDVEVQKGLHPSCDREAVAGIKRMPRWSPGKQNGNPVHVWFQVPVNFQIQN